MQKFKSSYQEKFKSNPSPTLAYVYDGIIMATEAIAKFGPDSEAIRAGFKNLEYNGITGKIEFGKLGNREY
jgi:ABC-type branched-subunit amino acid transport system substrate-binding protein